MPRTILTGAAIHDGVTLYEGHALVLDGDGVVAITRDPPEGPRMMLPGGIIAPGFVDLQVNGGGGVMFNDAQTPEVLTQIAAAHATTGTTAILPTLITDTPTRTQAAIEATAQAIAQNTPGIIGLHLEGPHLDPVRKGAHDPDLIRPMSDADVDVYLDAAHRIPNLLLTVAPENCDHAQIETLTRAGVLISLGHADASFATCQTAFSNGATLTTHLFNAMSQLGSRAPGLVGATLDTPHVSAGLIADGIHVHPATIRTALAAKRGPGQIFLVTDAMATVGASIQSFTLNGRQVRRAQGRLVLTDGTLAGADLTIPQALKVMVDQVGIDLSQAIRMATSIPAGLLNTRHGHIRPGDAAKLVHLNADLTVATPIRDLYPGAPFGGYLGQDR